MGKPTAKSLANLKPFQKGKSGNPSGRTQQSPELHRIKQLTASELAELANYIIKGDYETIRNLGKDPNATVLQRMVVAVATKIIMKGDMQALDTLLNRLIGKVKEHVEVTGKDGGPQVIVSIPSNGREVVKPDG